MPELPEVETIKRQLQQNILNKKITQVEIFWPGIIKNFSVQKFRKIIQGKKIENISRRSKLLILTLGKFSLVIHLKLTGQLIYLTKKEIKDLKKFKKKYTHLIYYFSDGSLLLHNDFRKFGYLKVIETQKLEDFFKKQRLGPEPLNKEFTLERFKELLKKKKKSKIKPLLMDQSFIAGVGNVYAQEACWWAKISPLRKVKDLKPEEIKNLYQSLKKVLKEAIKFKGSSVDTYRDIKGRLGKYVPYLKVYSREGEKCLRCGNILKKIKLGGRGTVYCPKCQK